MKILLVDQDPQNLEMLRGLLEGAPDTEVRTCASGDEALEIAQSWGGADLLITEVYLEPMNGFTLRNKMENRFANTRTIFVTAADISPYREYWEGYEVLMKPIEPEAVFTAIAKTFAPAPAVAPEEAAPAQPAPVPATVDEPPSPPIPAEEPVSEPVAEKVKPTPVSTPIETPVPSPAEPPPSQALRPPPITAPKPVKPVKSVQPAQAAQSAAKSAPAATTSAISSKPGSAEIVSGQTIGSYRIVRKLGDGKWGAVYVAVQTSMDRSVALKILSPELQAKPEIRQQFMANASAKANVDHPHILSVYEADEDSGHCYFTHEYVDGETLANFTAQGRTIDDPMALQIVKVVAEGLSYLNQNKIAHAKLDAGSIFIGNDKRPRLANLATVNNEHPETQEEIKTLGDSVLAALPGGRASKPGLHPMLSQMSAKTFASWPALLQTVRTLEPKVIPMDAFKLSAQDAAAIRAVESARKRHQRQLLWGIVGLLVLLVLAGMAAWWNFFRSTGRDFDSEVVKIPAGEFIYQDGQKVTLPEFNIDKYEVTIGQYAKFLAALQKTPTTQFDHPQQPRGKSHIPSGSVEKWNIYYARASSPQQKFHTVSNALIDINCPIFLVDYWDAYAYAKWRGRRLPTEQEWEKAARGTDGRAYPWGNDWDEKKANTGADFAPKPAVDYKPGVDGFVWWSPVDANLPDRSPYGVVGMAGNVSEWTDTRDPSGKFVIVRGGNYKSGADDAKVTHRLTDVYPEQEAESLGFRTVGGSEPPANAAPSTSPQTTGSVPQFRVTLPPSIILHW